MSKILISWLAFNNDFTWLYRGTTKEQKDKVNENGPTFSVHRHFGNEYKAHILLNSNKDQKEIYFFELLVNELKREFKHTIEPRQILIKDPIDISEIFSKVSDLLLEYKHCEIEIFVSPGTPQMQIAWYLVKPNFKKNVSLFQIRDAKFSASGKPERIYSNIDTLFNPTVLSVANQVASRQATENKILISKSIELIYEKAEQISNTKDVGCLLLGENGTGKENLALHIHKISDRVKKEFKAINCAAYSDDLLRSELFGHEKGSFTGASEQKIGVFEEANGGTIFLDEIGDISPKMQVSLLRVLQEKKIQRVGSSKDIAVNVRVIAATNKNLEELCENSEFRWDLFFRLAVTTLQLPALRDWSTNEKKNLIEHFNNIYFKEFPNRQEKLKFSKQVIDHLIKYPFKGNVRELQNLIISLYTFCAEEVFLEDLPDRIKIKKEHIQSDKNNIKEHTLTVLKSKKWNVKASAETLGIARETLYRRIKEFKLQK